MDALFVLRGRPGLGHVIPGLSIARELAYRGFKIGLVSYGAGINYLQQVSDFSFNLYTISLPVEYGEWAGLSIYDGGIGALAPLLDKYDPRLLVLGGEYMLAPAVKSADLHLSLLLNPEIMLKIDRNRRAATLFSRLFAECDSFVSLDKLPGNWELLDEFLPLIRKFLGFGPFPAGKGLPARNRNDNIVKVVVANGGGTEFPGITSSYSTDANLAKLWLYQTEEYTEYAIIEALKLDADRVEVSVFSSLPVAINNALRQRFKVNKEVNIMEVSPYYYDSLSKADVVVSRSGLGFVNDLAMTDAGIMLWALEGHEEQVLNARRVERERTNALFLKNPTEMVGKMEGVIEATYPLHDVNQCDKSLRYIADQYELVLKPEAPTKTETCI